MLLLLACSHENFFRLDSSKPEPTLRPHIWKDVMAFTKYETEKNDYEYSLKWRVGTKVNTGTGKRLASSKAWSGLGKKAKDRTNAKIKNREVRLVDLDRVLPARSFSNSLLRKAENTTETELSEEISRAFCYILGISHSADFKIKEVSGHVNKRCYVVDSGEGPYSSYNAATGEESLIGILRDSLECPSGSLVLIDEVEAGLHPTIQRKLCKVIGQISWEQKKQFVMTTHSSTIIDSFPPGSRRFLEVHDNKYRVISGISPQAALSNMDAEGHPLVLLYCEDSLASFLIKKVVVKLAERYAHFGKLINIVESGPASDVAVDFKRHKFRYPQVVNKIGFAAVFDGDMKGKSSFSELDKEENIYFIFPFDAPEKFMARAYLKLQPNTELEIFLQNDNHHAFFGQMVKLGLATDHSDARNICYDAFSSSSDFDKHCDELEEFLVAVATRFSDPGYDPVA